MDLMAKFQVHLSVEYTFNDILNLIMSLCITLKQQRDEKSWPGIMVVTRSIIGKTIPKVGVEDRTCDKYLAITRKSKTTIFFNHNHNCDVADCE